MVSLRFSVIAKDGMITSILLAVRAGMVPSREVSTKLHFSFISAYRPSIASISRSTHLPLATFDVKGRRVRRRRQS